jgi:GT2 family glycosyltransferase
VAPALVSVVIPCYRGGRYLAEAIESCLRQTHSELEVVVVDDASPGDDAAVAESYARTDSRVRVIRKPVNGGVSRAFNTGFAAARGEFFTRLAQDDRFREDALEVMLRGFESAPSAGLIYCDMQLIDAEGRPIHRLPTGEPAQALLPCNRIGICLMWRRSVWEAAGPFDPRFDTAEDYEFCLRLSRHAGLAKCPDAPFFARYHPNQGSVRFARRQDLACVRAQLSHRLAMIRRQPARFEHWKSAAGALRQLARRWVELKWYGERVAGKGV